jgi:hypothetical protein
VLVQRRPRSPARALPVASERAELARAAAAEAEVARTREPRQPSSSTPAHSWWAEAKKHTTPGCLSPAKNHDNGQWRQRWHL